MNQSIVVEAGRGHTLVDRGVEASGLVYLVRKLPDGERYWY